MDALKITLHLDLELKYFRGFIFGLFCTSLYRMHREILTAVNHVVLGTQPQFPHL